MPEYSKSDGWIGVDLDGTLAIYTHWDVQGSEIGEPVPVMLDRVLKWREEGITVKIVTARAGCPENMQRVREWLEKHAIGDLEITDRKDFNMIELWDDRAIRVQKNTGRVIQAGLKQLSRPRRSSNW